jgi:DNA-binding response OmpR family regulator
LDQRQAESALQRQCSILCVEDEADACELIQRILPEHRIVFASTGREALARMYSKAFDAYLLEYYLPDWHGVQLCREIRKTDPHVPVVFYTAAAREEDRGRAMRAGASAYLLKPADPEVLRSRLRVLLTLSFSESLKAYAEAQRVTEEELHRRAEEARRLAEAASVRGVGAIRRSEQSLEHHVRAKALTEYVDAGGTRALFDEAWPAFFAQARQSLR